MFSSFEKEKVAYFGLWAEEDRRSNMAFEALGVLRTAVSRCTDDDVRTQELEEVLSWVENQSARKNPVDRFRAALRIEHPVERKTALHDAYVRIARELGLFSGRL